MEGGRGIGGPKTQAGLGRGAENLVGSPVSVWHKARILVGRKAVSQAGGFSIRSCQTRIQGI